MDVTSSRGFAVQRGIQSSACLDIDNLLDPELKKRLGEPLERPLRAARPQRPQEAKVMSEIYARIAQECGKPLLEDVWRPTSHERFDASLENATRVFASVAHDIQDLFRIHERQGTGEVDAFSMPHPARPRSISVTSEEPRELINRDQMRKALEQQGFENLDACHAFQQLWDAIGAEGLDLQSFHAVLRHLKLHLLCGSLEWQSAVTGQVFDLPEERGFIGFIDWCPRRIDDNYFKRSRRPMDMFLTHRKPHMKMRWVHCARVERPTILRLAVKYQLHPLPVEDTIQLEQQSVPIVRKYNDNFFVVIPLLRLTEEAKRKLNIYKEHRTRRTFEDLKAEDLIDVPQVEQCRFAAFAAGPPHYDTVISFMTEWKVSKLHADNYDNEGQTSGRSTAASPEDDHASPGRPLMETPLPVPIPTPGGAVASMTGSIQLRLPSSRQDSGEEQDFFAGVVRQIQRDYSMLRSGNSSWVLWRLLDVTVDELSPILSAYRAQLRWFSSLITREEARVSKDVEKRLLRSKVELDWLQRKVRPMVKVLKHIIRDKAIDPDVTRYLEDIEDHLNTFLEEVSRIMGVCHSLRDEVNSYRDRQQQKVLYVLTLVTTLIMPTHLLTGIFGMNWQDEDGKPVVPGLGVMEEHRGYYLFWGLAVCLTTLIWFTFSRILKWI